MPSKLPEKFVMPFLYVLAPSPMTVSSITSCVCVTVQDLISATATVEAAESTLSIFTCPSSPVSVAMCYPPTPNLQLTRHCLGNWL